MRDRVGQAAISLLSFGGLQATIENGSRSTPLPNGVSDSFDTPRFDITTTTTTIHISQAREPQSMMDETGEHSSALVSIYIPSEVEVTDGDDDSGTRATRVIVSGSGKKYRIVSVHDYEAGLVRAMASEVSP